MRLTIDFRAYDAYIRSPEWAQKRRQALEGHGAFCRGCSRREALQVHHRTYERLGREELTDLVILCDACHSGVHALVASGLTLTQATDHVLDSRPSVDTRQPVPGVDRSVERTLYVDGVRLPPELVERANEAQQAARARQSYGTYLRDQHRAARAAKHRGDRLPTKDELIAQDHQRVREARERLAASQGSSRVERHRG